MDENIKAIALELNDYLFKGRNDLGFVGVGSVEPNDPVQFTVYCYGRWQGVFITEWKGFPVVFREGLGSITAQ